MTPYEILLSESQERMLLVAKAGTEDEVKRIFDKWDLDAVVIGRVTDDRQFRALFEGVEVVSIPINALTKEAPVYQRPVERPKLQDQLEQLDLSNLAEPTDLGATIKLLLGSPNIASKEWVYRQYDHFVRSNTVIAPGADAAVIRLKGTEKGLALTVDGNSRYCYLDPYVGGALTVAEAARNLACVGARPLGLTDCLNFGSPENPAVMWQFSQVIEGMFVRTHREAHFVRENPIVAGETQAAAPVACPAGVGNHFETFYAGRKLRFYNFDGGCLTVAQMEGRCRHAVFPGAGPGAAAKDFIVHIGPVAAGVASAQHQRGTAGPAGDSSLRSEGSQGSKNRLRYGEGRRHVGIDGRRKPRVNDTAFNKRRFNDACQSLIDGQEAVNQGDQAIGAGGPHQRRSNVCWTRCLIAAATEVEVDSIALLCDLHVHANRPLKINTVVIDEALSFRFAIGPWGRRRQRQPG